MLTHVKTLSLWEIAHYWHDVDPRESTTHQLPLKVRDTLHVLSMWCGKKLAYRVDREKNYLVEGLKHMPRFTARHYRHSFRKAIDSKVFGKRFFSKIVISRSQLARLCDKHSEELPVFWFPDKKYSFDTATDEESKEITANGRYQLVLIYDDTDKTLETTGSEQPIVATVNGNALKAAQASHAATNKIKCRFIEYYEAKGTNYSCREAAAGHFFDSLPDPQDKFHFASRKAAIATLLRGLRNHLKKTKS